MESNFAKYLKQNGLEGAETAQILGTLTSKSYKKGAILLHQGEICKQAYFVEKGLLRMYAIHADGKEHIIQFAPENWLLSDRSSLYFQEATAYFIDAIEDTTAYLLPSDFSCQVNLINPAFAPNHERILQNHIRQLQFRIHLLIGATAEERYLAFIQWYPDLLLRVPQWMIASYLGITPESLSRVRKELARKNQIR